MSIRIIVEAVGDRYEIVSAKRVDMVAPASPVDLQVSHANVYAEVRNAANGALTQQVVSLGPDPGVETFSSGGEPKRVEIASAKRTIVAILPDHEDAQDVVLLHSAPPTGGRRTQANSFPESTELARRSIDKSAK